MKTLLRTVCCAALMVFAVSCKPQATDTKDGDKTGAKTEAKACTKCPKGKCACKAKKCTKCEGKCKCEPKKARTKCEGECKCEPKKKSCCGTCGGGEKKADAPK